MHASTQKHVPGDDGLPEPAEDDQREHERVAVVAEPRPLRYLLGPQVVVLLEAHEREEEDGQQLVSADDPGQGLGWGAEGVEEPQEHDERDAQHDDAGHEDDDLDWRGGGPGVGAAGGQNAWIPSKGRGI